MPGNFEVINEYRAFYVVFQSSSNNRFWAGFTAEGFQHVWLFWGKDVGEPGLLTPQWTMKFEALATHFDIDLFYLDPPTVAETYINDPMVTDILKINLRLKTTGKFIPRGIISCISSAKSVMGITEWWVLTPKQLYYNLLRKGAKSLKV